MNLEKLCWWFVMPRYKSLRNNLRSLECYVGDSKDDIIKREYEETRRAVERIHRCFPESTRQYDLEHPLIKAG